MWFINLLSSLRSFQRLHVIQTVFILVLRHLPFFYINLCIDSKKAWVANTGPNQSSIMAQIKALTNILLVVNVFFCILKDASLTFKYPEEKGKIVC